MRVAAIDFGTNTARLLIADVNGDGFEPVCLEREIVRMGGGFCKAKGLSPEAIERGMGCLERFSALIRAHSAVQVRGVATSAVRDAANGGLFLKRVFDRTGLRLRTIDGVLEGRLTLAGVMAGLDRKHDEMVLFDIGGGSTEFTLVQQGEPRLVLSLPLGVVRLTEGQAEPAAIGRKIDKELEVLRQEMEAGRHLPGRDAMLIGTAGTATTLAAISLEMDSYDYRKVNNHLITREQILSIQERLAPLSPAERLAVPGLEPGREDLIIAGIILTLKTMDLFDMSVLKVSDYGLLEGLVVSELALED